ncbi:hypothetical protein MPSEU_000734900 [Mayamaea pseudoterrestris]|nr:hypothetical protein MPSEU_000734900 [Mayamaea pseudoterrestris]
MTAMRADPALIDMSSSHSSLSSIDDKSTRRQQGSEIPSLDLHGLTRDVAIRRVTDFLETHAAAPNPLPSSSATTSNNSSGSRSKHKKRTTWVCIITGSGSHSAQGPVLRSEVQKLLERRQMEYSRNTAGSFLVNAPSGITLYAQTQSVDSKIIVQGQKQQQSSEEDAVQEFMRNAQAGRVVTLNNPRPDASMNGSSSSLNSSEHFPSLQEVQREHNDIVKAQEESLSAFESSRKLASQEQSAIQAALALSQEQIDRERQEEEAAILTALEESKSMAELQLKEELDLMKKALDESKQESELQQQQESNLLKKALEDSKLQAELEQQHEQEAMAKALEESKRQMEFEEAQMNLILEESKRLAQSHQTSDELLLQKALEESQKAAKALQEEDLLLLRVMEASRRQHYSNHPREDEVLSLVLTQSARLAQQDQMSDDELIRRIMDQSLKDN